MGDILWGRFTFPPQKLDKYDDDWPSEPGLIWDSPPTLPNKKKV